MIGAAQSALQSVIKPARHIRYQLIQPPECDSEQKTDELFNFKSKRRTPFGKLIWLANPAEPTVWEAVDNWKADGSVSVALSNGTTHLFNVPYRYRAEESIWHRNISSGSVLVPTRHTSKTARRAFAYGRGSHFTTCSRTRPLIRKSRNSEAGEMIPRGIPETLGTVLTTFIFVNP